VTDHMERLGGGHGEVQNATFGKGAAIVDDNDDAAMTFRVGYPNTRAEWQRSVGSGEFGGIIFVAASSAASIPGAVKSGDSGKMWTLLRRGILDPPWGQEKYPS